MKKSSLALCVALLFSQQGIANETTTQEFNDTYRAYVAAVENKQDSSELAKKAFDLGKEIYGESADNTANLAINYANSLDKSEQEQRLELYRTAYEILEKNHGKLSVQVYDSLIGMAESTPSAKRADTYLDDVIAIAEKQNSDKLVADAKMTAARILAYKGTGERYYTAKEYLEEADKYYQENLPNNAVDRISADFLVAAFAENQRKYSTAIERLNHVVSVFDQELDFDHQTELNAHSKLVHLYEKTGKSDEATKHCLAIAKMVPWKESQEQEPLYRVPPKYPKSKAQRMEDGIVVMEFEVTPSGFVDNITVVDSEGGTAFEREAVKAMKKWRYAPKFENGQAIAATSRVQLDFKIKR